MTRAQMPYTIVNLFSELKILALDSCLRELPKIVEDMPPVIIANKKTNNLILHLSFVIHE